MARNFRILRRVSLMLIITFLLSSQSNYVARADQNSIFGFDSAERMSLFADYAPKASYKGVPLVKSIFDTYSHIDDGVDSLLIREDFENLYIKTELSQFVSPFGRTPVRISTDLPKSTINTLRQWVLQQGQAGLSWGNALVCSYIFENNGTRFLEKPILIDIAGSIEFSSDSSYPELRGLPGLGGTSSGGPINGPWVSTEQWFSEPINFSINYDEINQNASEDFPEGSLVKKIEKRELPTFFNSPGKFNISYGVTCSNSLDPSYNFKSLKSLNINIMPVKGQTTFRFQNPKSVKIGDKAIDISVTSQNDTTPIALKSLSTKTCMTFATSILLKTVGICKIQIIQAGNEDYAPHTQDFSFSITSNSKTKKSSSK